MSYEKTYLSIPVIPIDGRGVNIYTQYGSIMPRIPVNLERFLRIGINYDFRTNGYAPKPGTEFAAKFDGFGINSEHGRVMRFKMMTVNEQGKPDKDGKFHLEGPFEYPSRLLNVSGYSKNSSTTKFTKTKEKKGLIAKAKAMSPFSSKKPLTDGEKERCLGEILDRQRRIKELRLEMNNLPKNIIGWTKKSGKPRKEEILKEIKELSKGLKKLHQKCKNYKEYKIKVKKL